MKTNNTRNILKLALTEDNDIHIAIQEVVSNPPTSLSISSIIENLDNDYVAYTGENYFSIIELIKLYTKTYDCKTLIIDDSLLNNKDLEVLTSGMDKEFKQLQ